jgi:hypothetical protein
MKKYLSMIPTQSLIFFLICGAGILVFIFLIIIPTQKAASQLDKDIEKLTNQIEEQRVLKPVFESLLKRVKRKNPTELPATRKLKLALGDISKVSEKMQEIARNHDFKLQDIRTDVSLFTGNTGYLLLRVDVTGDFMRFRDFLVELGTIPYLERIEEIQIRAIEASREFKLKIWMAQK